MFGTKAAVLIGIALLFAATAFATCLVRGQAPQRLIVLLLLVALSGLVIGMSSPQLRAVVVVFAFGSGLLLFTLACFNQCFRRRVSALSTSPGWVAVTFVITNSGWWRLLFPVTLGSSLPPCLSFCWQLRSC